MSDSHLNADFSKPVVMHTSVMEWAPSPSPTVTRKRLDLAGPTEAGRVTSVVRYAPDSSFPSHPHPDGEEILVLDGVFSDETGDYPAGSFLLNPEGFEHAPFSKPGCILFVKLRQYPGSDRDHIAINMLSVSWDTLCVGVSQLVLYESQDHPERIVMIRLETGAAFTVPAGCGGAELFLLSGELEDDAGTYATGDWLRWPADADRTFAARADVTAYVKRGHLST